MTIWMLVALLLALVLLVPCAYLGLLALLAYRPRSRANHASATQRFAVVVPAHDEEAGIGATVASLLAMDYPRDRFRVVVVADNCSDATARVAREAGAEVWERASLAQRGKGYALDMAFARLLEGHDVDAVVVIDADTVVSRALLRAFSARLDDGAAAVQGYYAVRNPTGSWRTRLMAVALGMFHATRSLGRERLGLSCGLRGNGMCFSTALLRAHPHRAYSLVEDIEYGVAIGLAGHRVVYAHEALVLGEMVTGGKASESQRKRWEEGRLALARQRVPELLRGVLERGGLVRLDLALDLMIPPLSYVALGAAISGGVSVTQWAMVGAGPDTWICAFNLSALGLYVARGVQHSRLGWSGLVALAYAPFYIAWKLLIVRPFQSGASKPWVRTQRERPKG